MNQRKAAMTPLVFIDTETDGVHPDRKVWEVAMIRRDDSGEESTSFFVEIDLSTADPFGLKIGGFFDRHPLGRAVNSSDLAPIKSQYDQTAHASVLDEADAAFKVAKWTHGAHLVGAVPNFDAEVLSGLLRDNRLTPSWHYHLIDVEAMAVGALVSSRLRTDVPLPWKSDDLSRDLGVEPPGEDERHTALGDARWAMRIYDRIMGQ